jgi:3-deoxy-D-manno-octulosonic-acid transferase
LELRLRGLGLGVERTSGRRAASEPEAAAGRLAFVVDEHGILSELYGSCDLAYVGGGFRKAGLHSVIEPAVHGIPVLAGPSKSGTMSEVAELAATGQLELAESADAAVAWIARAGERSAADRFSRRMKWKEQALGRTGASRRAIERILSLLKPDG